MRYQTSIRIAGREIALDQPSYFIADIAANHDGELARAKELIWRAKEAGADCAKFQHFMADKIVSDFGFSRLDGVESHQSGWKKSVAEVYDQYHTRRDWSDELAETCRAAGIDFMTTPYDFEAIDYFRDKIVAYKIGSGDITFASAIDRMAGGGIPVLLACGAATMDETIEAAERILALNPQLVLMQCNTNYTGSLDNFRHVNLRVLQSFALRWPGLVLGLSDHTPGHSAVLGAVTLGARVIEKHFTDDVTREGPDHGFAMDPVTWRAMVEATRELELSLGDGVKRIEGNEQQTVIVQRRALRLRQSLPAGAILREEDLEALRPCPPGACSPDRIDAVVGQSLARPMEAGESVAWTDLN